MSTTAAARRLASPVRVAVAIDLGALLDGAWWPRTASISRELPELVDALSARLGKIIEISVNWSSLDGSPDLDALNPLKSGEPGRPAGRQRLMKITGSRASANLLVVPCRTSVGLAKMILRTAARLPIMPIERDTQEFRTSDDVVRAARAQSALGGQHPPDCEPDPAAPAIPD